MKKYNLTFEFKKTEEEARAFCERINAGLTKYMRKNKPAHFTPWQSKDGKKIYLHVGIIINSFRYPFRRSAWFNALRWISLLGKF